MADHFEQANAIWKTLDEMVVKDPEGYKRFIKEQMEEAQGFFKAQASKSTGKNQPGSSSQVNSGSSVLENGNGDMGSLFSQFALMGLDGGPSVLVGTKPGESKDKPTEAVVADQSKLVPGKSVQQKNQESKKNSLLDESIGNSVIASIVSNKHLIMEADEEIKHGEKDGITIQPEFLKNTQKKTKGKPLIEEL